MKKIFQAFILFVLSFAMLTSTFAQEMTGQTNLSIVMVTPKDAHTVEIAFSDTIDINSLRVNIENQLTKETVKVAKYSLDTTGFIAQLQLEKDLTTSTTYKLIVNSVISQKNLTIQDGIDAIREFVTPEVFSEEKMDFSAPTNTTAVSLGQDVMADTSVNSNTTGTVLPVEDMVTTASGEVLPKADDLPSAGSNIMIPFFLFAIILFAVLVSTKKRKA